MSATAPGVTPAKAPQGEPDAANRAVLRDGFQRIFRTTRRKATPSQRTKEYRLGRRQNAAISPDCENQYVSSRIQCSLSNFARRMAFKKSRSTSASRFPTMDGVATSTIVTGANKSCWWSRNVSRNKRRARLRVTAGPSLRLVMMPTRDLAPGDKVFQLAIKQPLTSRCPC